MLGLGRALSSGPLDSWYVEGVRALDPEQPIDAGLAGGQAAGSLALGLGALIGGAIPGLTPWPPEGAGLIATSAPFLGAAALTLVAGAFALRWLPRARPARRPRPARAAGWRRRRPARSARDCGWPGRRPCCAA